mgnify:CR=1 FL=1
MSLANANAKARARAANVTLLQVHWTHKLAAIKPYGIPLPLLYSYFRTQNTCDQTPENEWSTDTDALSVYASVAGAREIGQCTGE